MYSVGKHIKSRKLMILCLVLLIGLLSGVCIMSFANNGVEDKYIATVNGEPVYPEEFNTQMRELRADVLRYFYNKYQANETKDFWNKSYKGEVPIEYIKKKSLDNCVQIKVQQILAKKYNAASNIDYEALRKTLEAENAKRKLAASKGEVVYGPVEYNMQEYFSYTFSNMVIRLKESLLKGQIITFTAADLNNEYNKLKEKKYRLEDSIRFEKIVIPMFDKDGKSIAKQAYGKMEQVLQELKSGEAFESVAQKYNQDHKLQKQTMDASTARMDNNAYPELKDAANKLAAGEISEVVEANGNLVLLNCVERKAGGYRTFDEVRGNVIAVLTETRYEQLINKEVSNAKVKVFEKYNRISSID